MNTTDPRFELIRRCLDGEALPEELALLESNLIEDAAFRDAYVRYVNLGVALSAVAKAEPLPEPTPVIRPHRWMQWRPLTAAAAGLVIGMLCTSVVYGYVAQRAGVVQKVPLVVYNPGFESSEKFLDKGIPHGVGQWGVDSATVVSAENGMQPLRGTRMLRLEPISKEDNPKVQTSRAYQVLDLRALPTLGIPDDAEVQVTASFFATKGDVASRYLIRIFALNETPEQAAKDFWPKTQDDDVVSVAQRFETSPEDHGWHTFSLKMPLPRGAKSLVFILGAGSANDASAATSSHYLDDVKVSVLIPQAPLP